MVEPSWDALRDLLGSLEPRGELSPPEPIPGGASTRRYYRVRAGDRSVVAMFVPGAPTHEIHKDPASKRGGRWPFLEVRDLLAGAGVRVPAVYADGSAHGWLLLEDLGDETLARRVARSPDAKRALYQCAVRDLARAQRALSGALAGTVVETRAFDHALLLWELEHFREWAIDARGVPMSDDDRARFAAVGARIAARIASWPRGFVHRDYQSRNLMVVEGHERGADASELAWIDFQDALMGPRVYDLVALLSDSYLSFEPEFVRERLDEYAAMLGLSGEERARLGVEFELVTVQRKLKDAGRFVYLDRVNRNPTFLEFVDPTLEKVRSALRSLGSDPEASELSAILDRVLSRQ